MTGYHARTRAAFLGVLLGTAVFAGTAAAAEDPNKGTPADPALAQVEHVCSSCHGYEGRSVSPNFPRLSGQQKDYIIAQLKRFRDHTRAEEQAHTYMWGMASHLDDKTIVDMATWYSTRKPVVGETGDSAEVAAGKKVFEEGSGATDSPACQTCHGASAEGFGEVPRLAAQHRGYLQAQLRNFQSEARASDIMHQTSRTLTEQQISDVAAYLASR